jgi:multiphosphoryl transfer protein
MSNVILVAPLAGWSTPLDEAPDAVFAGRMLGDGLAIDPTGATLCAPCDGELIAVAESKHAITLRTPQGAEILLHVGIDTVRLGGEGFGLHVRQGRQVRTGEPLLSFDLDLLARRAKSLLTPVILLEGGGFTIGERNQNRELNVGDPLMELVPAIDVVGLVDRIAHKDVTTVDTPIRGATLSGMVGSVFTINRRLSVALEHGIHARPAALLAGALKGFASEVTLVAGGREASARSTVALLKLGVRKGEEIEIRASGSDAVAAAAAAEGALRSETGAALILPRGGRARASQHDAKATQHDARAIKHDAKATQHDAASEYESAPPQADGVLRGVIASRGLAVGRTVQLSRRELSVRENGAGLSHEIADLDRARSLVRTRLKMAASSGAESTREIIAAHLELLDDPELISGAHVSIAAGKSAGYGWRRAIREAVGALRSLGDARMSERVDDLLDLEAQVLGALNGDHDASPARELPQNTVLIAKELLPSELVALDASRLGGICMAAGGPTSHVAILAAAMGIPVLVAMGPGVLGLSDGTPVVLDAERGLLRIDPDRVQMKVAEGELGRRGERRAAEQAAAQREGRTADGTRIEVLANVGSVTEAEAAVRNGAEGCGLLRTEFLFLERQSPPDEGEQTAEYQRIATALAGRPLTLRTLDIGGDKPIPYLPLPHEDNPALGLRGVRTSLWRPDLLRVQLRAVLAIQPEDQARILLPMITDPAEIRTVRGMLDEERRSLGRNTPIDLGVMIETPAAALMSDRIAAEADFLSIGTNDLTQYTLAMDRGHPKLASRLDALHPAVLRLIARTTGAAISHGRRIAVCGGLASDPTAVPILIGLGVDELSVVPSVIPQLKALIGTLSLDVCRELARQVLELETAEAVRALTLHRVSGHDAIVSVHE